MHLPLSNPSAREHEAEFASAMCRATLRLGEAEEGLGDRKVQVKPMTNITRAYAELSIARIEADYAGIPDDIFQKVDNVARAVLIMINEKAARSAGIDLLQEYLSIAIDQCLTIVDEMGYSCEREE